MSNMHLTHDKAMLSDTSPLIGMLGAVNTHTFANGRILSNEQSVGAILNAVFSLRRLSQIREWINFATGFNFRVSLDDNMFMDMDVIADRYSRSNRAIGSNKDIFSKLSQRVNKSCRVNLAGVAEEPGGGRYGYCSRVVHWQSLRLPAEQNLLTRLKPCGEHIHFSTAKPCL